MISPSKRRRSELRTDEAFTLHVTSARRLATRERIWRASLGALIAAVVMVVLGLFVPVVLAVQLAGLVVGAAIGALIPARPQTRRALAHIAAETGLAYESALDLQTRRAHAAADASEAGAPGRADEFGLEARLLERARRSVRDYRPESAPPWWLPVAIVALAVVALSRIVPGLAAPTQPPSATASAAAEPVATEPLEFGDDLTPALPAAGRAEAPSAAKAPGSGAETRDALPPGGSEAGNEALSRFMEALRQSPSDGKGSGDQAAAAPGSASSERSLESDQQRAAQRGEQPLEPAESPPGTRPGDQSSEQASSRDGADQEGSQGDQGANARPSADPGQSADDTGAAASRQGEGQPGAEGTADDSAGDERKLEEGGQAVAGGDADQPGGSDSGGEGGTRLSGAGDEMAGAVGTGGGEVPDDGTAPEGAFAAGAVELLPGVVLDGPVTPAGNVRLPGDDQVQLPPGVSLAPYATAVEEALGEGDLPAGYQEIIRRYFR